MSRSQVSQQGGGSSGPYFPTIGRHHLFVVRRVLRQTRALIDAITCHQLRNSQNVPTLHPEINYTRRVSASSPFYGRWMAPCCVTPFSIVHRILLFLSGRSAFLSITAFEHIQNIPINSMRSGIIKSASLEAKCSIVELDLPDILRVYLRKHTSRFQMRLHRF